MLVIAARRYAGAIYAVIVCLSVCLSVAGRLNLGSHKQRRTLAGETKTPTGSPPMVAPNTAIFDQYFAMSQKWCKIGTLLLWNANRNSIGAISSDFE